MAALAQAPMITRVLLVNATVLAGVFLLLAVTPAPVTFPEDHWETALLLKGAAILLAANILALHLGSPAAPKPKRGRRVETASDTLVEMRSLEHFHVASPDGVIGVVDEVICDSGGKPIGLLVCDGWFAARRFLVPLTEILEVDPAERTILIVDRRSGS